MTHMTLADFEALYRRDPDPWGYETSPYEQAKYAATLAACGPGPFSAALELGASIGVLSAQLAPRCERLVTIDAAATAVAAARRRLADRTTVAGTAIELVLGEIPDDIPDGPYELVVASEILYYLEAEPLERTLGRIREVTVPGARIVAVHWSTDGPERPTTATAVHRRLHAEPWLAAVSDDGTEDYLLDVMRRR